MWLKILHITDFGFTIETLSFYVTIWIDFHTPQIEPVLYLRTISSDITSCFLMLNALLGLREY